MTCDVCKGSTDGEAFRHTVDGGRSWSVCLECLEELDPKRAATHRVAWKAAGDSPVLEAGREKLATIRAETAEEKRATARLVSEAVAKIPTAWKE